MKSPTETVASLYAFVERHQDRIVDYCIDSERMLSAGTPEPALRRAVEAFLGQMLPVLRADGARGHSHVGSPTTVSGRWAFAGGVGIMATVRELGLISEAICAVAAGQSVAFAAREYEALNQVIMGAISAAVAEFLTLTLGHVDRQTATSR